MFWPKTVIMRPELHKCGAARFFLIWPIGRFWYRVSMSICLFVCLSVWLWQFKTPTSRCPGGFWLKGISLILAWKKYNYFFLFFPFNDFLGFSTFSGFWSQPTVDIGGVSRGGSVAAAVGLSDRWHTTFDIPPKKNWTPPQQHIGPAPPPA